MKEFKDRLKFLRKTLNLTQSEMAKALGLARSRLSELESGKTQPRESLLRLISHTFGVSYEWLKEGKGEMWEREKRKVPVWLKEFMKNASEEEVRILKAFLEMLKEVPEEERPLLEMMIKKWAGSSQKK